ncbi:MULTISPECIES: F0F1 ATP synthase subunit B [unclassified Mycobacterium]|uniref:F0F1 ATP synthase subunit B n=1 Tax=unclassified Mycobacterium TaxID=2642494 RepID=UPI0008001FDD|nr:MULTISPECIES: F0F1 ATP synthase subunit B [unclassified Mycobacterium]OBG55011.1 F0F1 ATP synthase subunit B [Mycobacterium sp. E735]OBG58527.1 F0F1 ATP synthase subunit B [Mycobacterium sp. E188]OBG82814.1 F0F1 ATP synthase subunit B [Mycobacterium sp. E3305]OBG88009.1 F0F1 ATP synthase subunit B [Mycobacterium sp. E3298]OBH39200.1 F0F1 ATP synthase subunit B [Mycobacterium sp. E183]
MGDASLSVLASSQVMAEGGNNFLVPNGTFFFVLAIFLIVLAVIGTFVVPPVMRVLRERDNMVAKTAADNKKATEQFDAAKADYEEALTEARVQASSLRDNARAEGRKVVEDARARAEQQVMSTLQMASEQLKRERDAVELDLRANVAGMSAKLASRILGVEVAPATTAASATGKSGR